MKNISELVLVDLDAILGVEVALLGVSDARSVFHKHIASLNSRIRRGIHYDQLVSLHPKVNTRNLQCKDTAYSFGSGLEMR